MNFSSEADVHAFIEKQASTMSLNPIFHAELNPASDENDIEILQQSLRRTRTGKGAATAAGGSFGELLARSLAEQENAAAPEENYTKLEDMFPEETTAKFRERFFENPLLCDEVPSKDQQKRLRVKDIAGSIRSFASSRFGSSSARDGESEESPHSIVRMMSGDETPLPRPATRSSSSRQRSMKKVSFDQFVNANDDENEEEIEAENRRMSFRRPRLSLPTIVQRIVVRIGSFGKNDEIIRDPGSSLPLPFQKRQSVDSRKSSKTTVATDDSKTSVSSRLMKFFTV